MSSIARLLGATGVVVLLAFACLCYWMTAPHVIESAGFTAVSPEAIDCTLSGAFPASASNVRYCSASAGLGGRLLAYRFSGELAELHQHALAEFAAHWDAPKPKIIPDVKSPFGNHTVWPSSSVPFHAKTDWMTAQKDSIGWLYVSADDQQSHRPTIFVDETHRVLYFWMAD